MHRVAAPADREFDWLGKRYRGSHEPLVSVELWERVQEVLDGRHTARARVTENDFLFTGLIHCRHCDRLRERMKQIYIDNLDGRIEDALDDAAARLMPLVGDVATARSYTSAHVGLSGGLGGSSLPSSQ